MRRSHLPLSFFLSILVLFSMCIPFRENPLDPNGPINSLITLGRLNSFLNAGLNESALQEWELRFQYRVGGAIANEKTYLTIYKVDPEAFQLEDFTGNLTATTEIDPTSAFITETKTYFPSMDGNFPIHADPGTYIFNHYNLQGEGVFSVDGIGAFTLDSDFQATQPIELHAWQVTDPNAVIGIISPSAVPKIENRRYQAEGLRAKSLGFYDGKHFYIIDTYNPTEMKVRTNSYTSLIRRMLAVMDATGNWSYISLPQELVGLEDASDIATPTPITRSEQVFYSRPLYKNTAIHFFVEKNIQSSSGTPTKSFYHLSIPTANPQESSLTQIQPRNGSATGINFQYFYLFQDGIVYGEDVGLSDPEIRFDSNFLQTGSTNNPLPTAVSSDNLFELNAAPPSADIFTKSGILYAETSPGFYKQLRADQTGFGDAISVSTTPTIIPSQTRFWGNPYGFIYSELDTTNSIYKISFFPTQTIPMGPIDFTISQDYPASSVLQFKTLYSENRTWLQLNRDSLPTDLIAFDHGTGQFVTNLQFPPNPSLDTPPPGLVFSNDSSFNLEENCSLSPQKIQCVAQVSTLQTTGNFSFQSHVSYVNESVDGITWSGWKSLPDIGF